jgi:hypothetical protein
MCFIHIFSILRDTSRRGKIDEKEELEEKA